MKGKLTKTEQGWEIKYFDTEKAYSIMYCGESIPLHPNDQELMLNRNQTLWDGQEVEFEISKVGNFASQITLIPYVSDDFQIGPDGAYEHKESKKVSWDELFNDVESKLDIYIPIRAINYIKNNYKKPKRKK